MKVHYCDMSLVRFHKHRVQSNFTPRSIKSYPQIKAVSMSGTLGWPNQVFILKYAHIQSYSYA